MASTVRVKNITSKTGATAVIDLDTGVHNPGDGGLVRRAFELYVANRQLVVVSET
jgi:hypothetical protein